MNPSVSVKNRSLRDTSRMRTRTRTRNGSMDACLSFTTVSNFTDTDTYTDHGQGSQITDIWMASLNVDTMSSLLTEVYIYIPLWFFQSFNYHLGCIIYSIIHVYTCTFFSTRYNIIHYFVLVCLLH